MSKYTLTIEGDFEKYNCKDCPLGILSVSGFVCVMDDRISCPLEEVKQGEWKKSYQSGMRVSSGFVSSCCDMWNERRAPHCPNCGADMRGGKE